MIDVSTPKVMAGLFVQCFLSFSVHLQGAVGRAAMSMIQEVRRQFHNIPSLKNALEIMNRNEGSPQMNGLKRGKALTRLLMRLNTENA